MERPHTFCNPEIWGGVECTINRVGDTYRDQLEDAGHYARIDDLEHFAGLGFGRIRYPVLWEHHDNSDSTNWYWIEKQLDYLRAKNIIPIAGLMHHGSGPKSTDLLDENFAVKLAAYAGEVASRFPWLEYYTPVNEPLTTARFSGLYGFWYPHHTSEFAFYKMLLNQIRGIILSMQSIRKINPNAKLIQTEDLSKTHGTPLLSYQAEFENKRRWLTYDLLCGKLNRQHYFWNYLINSGIGEQELQFFLDNSCPPDIMGFNYYVTSERFLDENLHAYPLHTHGGNGKDMYADIAAAGTGTMQGIARLIQEAWSRYRLPLAITECHLNGSEEDQLTWWKEIWDSCCNANRSGMIVQAVTAWSLLGAFDWNSLLLENNNYYEKGVYDISDGYLRPTLLAEMISSISRHGNFHHPVPGKKGWWNENQWADRAEAMPL